jgi:ribosomal-protein-alanine N-acetyltransferase
MLVLWMVIDEAHIGTLAVHPEYRRRKVATRLLATALQSMLDAGVRRVTLDVRAGNIAAQRLYRKFGFYTVTRRPRYYRDNHEDAFLMALSPLTTRALAGQGEVASPAHLVSG